MYHSEACVLIVALSLCPWVTVLSPQIFPHMLEASHRLGLSVRNCTVLQVPVSGYLSGALGEVPGHSLVTLTPVTV